MFLSHSNQSSSLPLELIDRFLYEGKIDLKLIKIYICSIESIESRIDDACNIQDGPLCDNCYRIEAIKTSVQKQFHRKCYSGSRSRLSGLMINISVMSKPECSSKWFQMYYSNASGKNDKQLRIVKIERQIQFLKEQHVSSVCFQTQRKKNQKTHFTYANAINEKV